MRFMSYRCDVCGALVDESPSNYVRDSDSYKSWMMDISLQENDNDNMHHLDLCDRCKKAIGVYVVNMIKRSNALH